ncbi:MAG: hypothetical protein MJZ68_10070 [archaeon]|nr:hypothetical protein [archaeon]
MKQSIVTWIGAVAALIGFLTLFMQWYELTLTVSGETGVWNYTGLDALLTGDFDGGTWSGYESYGRYLPTVAAVFFIIPIFNFTLLVEESHTSAVFYQVALSAVCAVVARAWIEPGEVVFSGGSETHDYGIGPLVCIAMAAVCSVTAFMADRHDDRSKVDYAGYDIEEPKHEIRYETDLSRSVLSTGKPEQRPVEEKYEYCPYCHARVDPDSEFCDECFKRIKEKESSE